MRYDKKIWFCKEGEKVYNRDTGNYQVGEESKDCRYGAVTATRESLATILYGSLVEGTMTIHIQQQYDEPFSYIRIGEPESNEYIKKYTVDWKRPLRQKQVFVVHEVQ